MCLGMWSVSPTAATLLASQRKPRGDVIHSGSVFVNSADIVFPHWCESLSLKPTDTMFQQIFKKFPFHCFLAMTSGDLPCLWGGGVSENPFVTSPKLDSGLWDLGLGLLLVGDLAQRKQ